MISYLRGGTHAITTALISLLKLLFAKSKLFDFRNLESFVCRPACRFLAISYQRLNIPSFLCWPYIVPVYKFGKIFKLSCVCSESSSCKACEAAKSAVYSPKWVFWWQACLPFFILETSCLKESWFKHQFSFFITRQAGVRVYPDPSGQ